MIELRLKLGQLLVVVLRQQIYLCLNLGLSCGESRENSTVLPYCFTVRVTHCQSAYNKKSPWDYVGTMLFLPLMIFFPHGGRGPQLSVL